MILENRARKLPDEPVVMRYPTRVYQTDQPSECRPFCSPRTAGKRKIVWPSPLTGQYISAKSQVVWHVLDSRINFVKDKTEGKDTDIVFEIARKNGKTELRFTHLGLVPALECYGDCSKRWDFYIAESLRGLITTGRGQPSQKEHKATRQGSR